MLSLAMTSVPAHAADEAGDQSADKSASKLTNKLTIGVYRFADTGDAIDINLRNTSDYGNVWLGYYEARRRDEHQGRAGWDNTWEWSLVRVTPSAQMASRGYANGSIAVEAGERWFIGGGYGRTNLRPNWNLNFDPNDAWSVATGYRADGQSFALLLIGDDRENPDQRHLHVNWRKSLGSGDRVTVDVLRKRGIVDGETIHRTGFTLTYDWPRWFARLAFDPKVNFTNEDMWRVAFGTRF